MAINVDEAMPIKGNTIRHIKASVKSKEMGLTPDHESKMEA